MKFGSRGGHIWLPGAKIDLSLIKVELNLAPRSTLQAFNIPTGLPFKGYTRDPDAHKLLVQPYPMYTKDPGAAGNQVGLASSAR